MTKQPTAYFGLLSVFAQPAKLAGEELTLLGFWCTNGCARVAVGGGAACTCGSACGLPQDGVHGAWAVTEAATYAACVRHLRRCMLESWELGNSWCRVSADCPGAAMGCASLTDGTWVWPEGYAHYLAMHSVRPPEAFVRHVLACAAAQARSGVRGSCVGGEHDSPSGGGAAQEDDVGLPPLELSAQYNAATRQPEPLPSATVAWLLSRAGS